VDLVERVNTIIQDVVRGEKDFVIYYRLLP
jgi:hypothetical protein